jgi:DNA-binding CsgD family transcriptional regulator
LGDARIDCVEQGYLEYGLAMMRLFEVGDVAGAHAHFVQVGKIGARYAHREIVTLGRIGEGRMLIYMGEIAEGLALLDEAIVSIEADELPALVTGDAYCSVIDACWELFDVARCRAWTDSFERWCDTQQELVLYRGHCFLHRAELLGLLGAWSEALVAARCACDRLADPVHPMALASASIIEGDLLRLDGDTDGAEAAYQRATDLGRDPQPGLALLRAGDGSIEVADAMIRRVLAEAVDPMSRARVLEPFVEIVLRVGDVAVARGAAEELRAIAVEFGTPMLRALGARALGSVLLAEGDATPALVELRQAFQELVGLEAGYEAARTRVLLADACAALGDHDAAEREMRAAQSALDALAAARRRHRSETTPTGLTKRELEVLRLLARGDSNRAIAAALVISEKTVASHVMHIFTKLGVGSRAAATAYAYDHDLL